MTKKELQATARSLRSQIESQRVKLERAVTEKRLPPSVTEFGFLASVGAMSGRKSNNNPLKAPLSNLKKDKLEAVVKELTFLRNTETFTQSGYKSRLKELKQASIDTAVGYGVPSDVASKWRPSQWTKFWKLVDLLQETYNLPSSVAIKEASRTVEESGKTIGEFYKQYVGTYNHRGGKSEELKTERLEEDFGEIGGEE